MWKRLSRLARQGAGWKYFDCVRDTLEIREFFPQMKLIPLPVPRQI